MAYTLFDQTKPNGGANGSVTLQHIRENLTALRDIVTLGAAGGWNYSCSGGSAGKPNVMLWAQGVERLRATCTWGASGGALDNLVNVVFAYSSNGGGAYDTIGTQSISYTAAGDVESTSWS